MLTIDLCSGAGGLTRGLLNAGFDVEVAVEKDQHAATSYRANFPHVDLIQEDIRCLDLETVCRKLRNRPLGAIVAGLPCQGFSESNRITRSAENRNNKLYRIFRKFVSKLQPRWFLLENVNGLTTLESGLFLQKIIRSFRSAGYTIQYAILNAADFGVPQLRRRAFIVGHRLGHHFDFQRLMEQGATSKSVSVRDAIADLPVLRNGSQTDLLPYRRSWEEIGEYARLMRTRDCVTVSGNSVSRNCERVVERYRHIDPGENWAAIPRRLMKNYATPESCHTGIYYRLKWNAISKVIGNFRKNMLVHPSQGRGLSIREAARLQSFPDDHLFLGPLNDRQQQVGDAVPPLLAEAVGKVMMLVDAEVAITQRRRRSRIR